MHLDPHSPQTPTESTPKAGDLHTLDHLVAVDAHIMLLAPVWVCFFFETTTQDYLQRLLGAAGAVFDSKVLPTLLPFHTAWNTSVLPVTCKMMEAGGSTRAVVSHRIHGRKAAMTKAKEGCENPLMPCSGGQMALQRIHCSSSFRAGHFFPNSHTKTA